MKFRDENWETFYLEDIQQIMESVMDMQYPKIQQTIGLFKGEKEAHGDVMRQAEEADRYGVVGSQEKFPSAMTC